MAPAAEGGMEMCCTLALALVLRGCSGTRRGRGVVAARAYEFRNRVNYC